MGSPPPVHIQPGTPSAISSVKPSRRWRSICLNLSLGLGVSFAVVAAVEGILRISGKVPTEQIRGTSASEQARIPGPFAPGQRVLDRNKPAIAYTATINSLGFRVPEVALPRAPGAFRILCLGDSYTFGAGVQDDQTWPWRLQEQVGREVRGTSIEVINGGVAGFTILDERLLLEEKISSIEPTGVILEFTGNDISDLSKPVPIRKQMQEHARVKSQPIVGPLLVALQDTAIFNGLQMLLARYEAQRGGHGAVPTIAPEAALVDPAGEPLWALYEEHLIAIRDLLASKRIPFLFVAFPSSAQIPAGAPAGGEARLATMAGRLGVPFLDLLPALREAGARGDTLYLLPADGHPAPDAYAAAGEEIAGFVRGHWLTTEPP